MSAGDDQTTDPDFSLGRLVAVALGGAVVVLAVTALIVFLVAKTSAVAALVVALLGVVVMVAVIALVSKRMLRDVQRRIDELKADS